jgi:Rieske Fe-S protein
MSQPDGVSRRGMLATIGIGLNAVVGVILAVPIVRYLLAPAIRVGTSNDESWLSLGAVDQFPVGETRLATYRNPITSPSDGETANLPCWVRRVDAAKFQVFAINCAHLGCPVRWFPQSGLFMCPCHGGVYYEDGSRASGPPERGLFEYPYKVEQGMLSIKAGRLPTPGNPTASLTNITPTRTPCA